VSTRPIDGRRPGEKDRLHLSIVIGSILIIGGVATWIVVSTTLADQKIVVSDDASCLAGDEVDGPFSAYCEATVIDKHALEATGGLRYAEAVGVLFILIGLGIRDVASRIRDLASRSPATA
jgi:hypothetical protein